jgi:hypothetical protein
MLHAIMSKVLAFRPLAVVPYIYCVMKLAWPEEHLYVGDICTIACGTVNLGQVIALRYRGYLVISRLISNDTSGRITICGSTGIPVSLSRGQYKIEGVLMN